MLRKVRLRYVEVLDFRKSEATNFRDFAHRNAKLLATFKDNDVVMFLSLRQDQMVFCFREELIADRAVLQSSRLRLSFGHWSPALLGDYAKLVGLKLEGIQTFAQRQEEHNRANPHLGRRPKDKVKR